MLTHKRGRQRLGSTFLKALEVVIRESAELADMAREMLLGSRNDSYKVHDRKKLIRVPISMKVFYRKF
ncbi:hypothetical protein J6590_021239 [Homalodisca vitripennis]|nr:hypothetical protein J6590_021239 [Homalodisca vitripennis]